MKVVTIGSATLDVYLQSKAFKQIESEKFLTGVGECLALGSKNEVNNIFVDTGGGATNTAVSFANLGLDTSVMTRIGDDLFGKEVEDVLVSRNINTEYLQKDNKITTSYSTLLLLEGGQRSILVYRGASNKLVMPKKIEADWFYISSLGGDIKLLDKLLSHAKKNNIKVVYNPGGGELKLGLSKLKKYFKKLEVLNFNREEASTLCNVDYNRMDIMIKKLNNLAPYVVITDGPNGAFALHNNMLYFAPTLKTKPVNTTGAGDAFGSALVSGLILKTDIEFGLQLGTLNSDGVIRKMGAKNGLLEKMPTTSQLKKIKISKEPV